MMHRKTDAGIAQYHQSLRHRVSRVLDPCPLQLLECKGEALLQSPEAVAGDKAAVKHRGVDRRVGQGALAEAHAGGAGDRGSPHRKPRTRKDAA